MTIWYTADTNAAVRFNLRLLPCRELRDDGYLSRHIRAKRVLKFLLIATIKRVHNELKLRVHVACEGIFSFKVCDRNFLPLICSRHAKRYSTPVLSLAKGTNIVH